jgi:hypothetical protein
MKKEGFLEIFLLYPQIAVVGYILLIQRREFLTYSAHWLKDNVPNVVGSSSSN